jgi:hypothetical protein
LGAVGLACAAVLWAYNRIVGSGGGRAFRDATLSRISAEDGSSERRSSLWSARWRKDDNSVSFNTTEPRVFSAVPARPESLLIRFWEEDDGLVEVNPPHFIELTEQRTSCRTCLDPQE